MKPLDENPLNTLLVADRWMTIKKMDTILASDNGTIARFLLCSGMDSKMNDTTMNCTERLKDLLIQEKLLEMLRIQANSLTPEHSIDYRYWILVFLCVVVFFLCLSFSAFFAFASRIQKRVEMWDGQRKEIDDFGKLIEEKLSLDTKNEKTRDPQLMIPNRD